MLRLSAEMGIRSLSAPDGTLLSVAEFGGAGAPVVFVHGLAGHGGEWRTIANLLGAGYRRVALDLRGHGLSERRPQDVSLETQAGDVAKVIEHVAGGGPVVLVGQSLGGILAFVTAARHPELVQHLVVVEASPAGPHLDAPGRIERWLHSWPRPFPDQRGAQAFFGGSPHAEGWVDGLEERADGLWPRWDADVLVAMMASASARDWWDSWSAVRCPALLVRGDRGWIPEAELVAMAHWLPSAKVVTVAGAGHDVHLDKSEELVAAIAAFIGALRASD